MTHIYTPCGKYVAAIKRTAQSYRPEEPWLLLYKTGRVDRFVSYAAAREEAAKTWPACHFRKTQDENTHQQG